MRGAHAGEEIGDGLRPKHYPTLGVGRCTIRIIKIEDGGLREQRAGAAMGSVTRVAFELGRAARTWSPASKGMAELRIGIAVA